MLEKVKDYLTITFFLCRRQELLLIAFSISQLLLTCFLLLRLSEGNGLFTSLHCLKQYIINSLQILESKEV